MIDILLYSFAAGVVLGVVLAYTRPHMTGRATFGFMMLYYFLFTGFVNIQRLLFDHPELHRIYEGFTRALVFTLSASGTVALLRKRRRRQLVTYMNELERKQSEDTT